jgi:hypothetical protein
MHLGGKPMSISLNIPYSAQYTTITKEGHERAPPSFGAPTLIWHLAISPHWPGLPTVRKESLQKHHARLATDYEETHRWFFGRINELLITLQERGALPSANRAKTFQPQIFERGVPPPWPPNSSALGEPFLVADRSSIHFTLWWRDAGADANPEPDVDALRVRVHAEAHRDFATVSLFIDAGKPWNDTPIIRGEDPPGMRRGQIFSAVNNIQKICEDRLAASGGVPPVDKEILPEDGISDTQAEDLMRASRYLYSEIWDDFCVAFGITDLTELLEMDLDHKKFSHVLARGLQQFCDAFGITYLAGLLGWKWRKRYLNGAGRIFANFRGLVLPTAGLGATSDTSRGSSGAKPFARFLGNGGLPAKGADAPKEINESNAVVKAFWPFIRRITPFADQREFIACGLLNWRALYVTALGSPRAFDWREEGRGPETNILAGHLPEGLMDQLGRYDSLHGNSGEGPLRYLILTKGEPHRQQIGRIVDRINIMGTMRLIALRDWTIIRDASTQIQLRGLELDTIMKKWSVGSRDIQRRYKRWEWFRPFGTRRRDNRDERLQELATDVEQSLIHLSAALDEVGSRAVHGLPFRINRSRFYIAEFMSLLESLNIGNIDTWLAYDQFVKRGLKPAFDFIDGVGTRLLGLRNRLQSVLEGIETSALVIQTAATRSNTAQLRRLAWSFKFQNVVLAIVGLAFTVSSDRVLSEAQVYIIWLWDLFLTSPPQGR